MKLKKQIILIAAICMLFGVAGYSLNNQKASADTDNDIEVQTEKPSETENPGEYSESGTDGRTGEHNTSSISELCQDKKENYIKI